MAFASSTFQRVLDNEFFTNTLAEDQPQTSTVGTLIANLNFVRNAISSLSTLYLPINNPTFTGLLTGPIATIPSITGNTNFTGTITAPSANLTSISSTTLSATTINGNPNFSGNPTLQNYNLGVRIVGEIKMLMPTTSAYTPPFYLLCDGSSYSTSTYNQLFTAIGYAYGGSGGSFNVPSFASRFPIGGNGSVSGCSSSNYATGNGQGGYTNTQKISYNYGNASTNLTPLLQEVPPHSHNTIYIDSVLSTITPIGVQQYLYSQDGGSGVPTDLTGSNIQQTDSISGGEGVNITPSYISCNFWICYQ